MVLSHITTPLLGVVATAVIGQLGSAELLGAIALGAIVFDFLFWGFGAFRMTTAGLTAQATGAKNKPQIDLILARSFLIAITAGAFLILSQSPIKILAGWFYSDASPAVMEAMFTYFSVRIWAAPLTLSNYVILGSILGRARTDIGLCLQIAINLSNIALSLLLVLVLDFGIKGVALASVLAEATGVLLGIIALKYLGSNPFNTLWKNVINKTELWHMLAVNRDIMIRTACLLMAFALFSRQGVKFGAVALAANAILYNMFLVGSYFLDGFATAAETLGGQSIGARNRAAFERVTRLCLIWCMSISLCIAAFFMIISPWFIDMLSTNEDIRTFARSYVIFAAFAPLIGSAAFVFDGIFIGATWSAAMRDLMAISFGIFVAVLLLGQSLGNTGLWIAFVTFLGARGLGQALLYPKLTNRTFNRLTSEKP
ncbi:MATE family efflux transporter [Microvirga sp. W0021]|uniref:MATE family efflux transporter n=1 Tax=Hohaiivirga grylli TaxID=3133970 RepID=A0ABV0BKT9_9HYPH